MRSRASALVLAPILACALAPAAAHAAAQAEPANIKPYTAVVDSPTEASALADLGYDMTESGYDRADSSSQELHVYLSPEEASTLESRGVDTTLVPYEPATPKNKAIGSSPNPFFNVWRSYSEPGGIADEMRATVAANPDVMKLEQLGVTQLGKPILVIKMTADARNTPDGTRPALLFSAVNHAREWVAAEQGRRLPVWFAQHKNDPKIKEIIGKTELWFMPVQNVDGYDFTFTCGLGADQVMCDYRNPPAGKSPNRQWRKTLRDNNNNGIFGDSQDGVDPNRNYPAKRAIDEEGASNTFNSQTYRGPYALSEAGNLAVDRLQRRVKFFGNINYHTDGQLLLTPVSYTTDYAPPDATIFAAMTGTDGDSAVFPYQPQRSSDLYESNGDTIDNGYLNYGIIGWTPEMDTCETGGDFVGCPGFSYPDQESKMKAVFDKNLAFALNTANSLLELDRPKNYDNDPNHYQIKPTQDIQPNLFDVSYGVDQQVEAIVRKTLGPSDIRVTLTTPGNIATKRPSVAVVPMTAAPSGERYGEVPGYYFERRRASVPSVFPAVGNASQPATYSPARPPAAGDIVNVRILAGGLQQEFNYRVESVKTDPAKKRVLVIAGEDYKGVSPNVKPGYDTAPRYLSTYKTALEGLGYEVATFDIDNPPANGGTPNGVVRPQIKYPTSLGVLKHFDAVVYESGDDFVPQDITNTNPKRMDSATTQTGSNEMASWFHHEMLELRDYANEGGKLIVAGRNVHQAPTGTTSTQGTTSLSATGPYTWTPDKLFGFNYPDNNAGDDDLPGTAFQRSRTTSNDTWQNYLGVSGRQGGVGTTTSYAGAPIAPKADGILAGMGDITVDSAAGNDPNQNADGTPAPASKTPIRLRNWAGANGAVNEPLRAERIEADFSTTPAQNATGGAIISTRDSVTFGFGLEQVDATTRSELLKRSLSYLVPATADTTAPTIVGFKWPQANSTATPADPIEVDVTAYDNRGDLKQVNLYADGALVGSVPVFPFQFRYTPPASKVGSTVKLTAEAVDKAGNKSTRDLQVNVLDADAQVLSPVPVNKPTLSGSPLVGQTLSCVNGGFLNGPRSYSYEWLRAGTAITGATAVSYTLTDADLGRTIACRMSATNTAGTADSTSEALYVSAPAAAPNAEPAPNAAPVAAPVTTTTTTTTTTTKTAAITFAAACKLAGNRKSISCAVSSSTTTKFTGSIRLQGHKTASASKSGKKKVTLTVRAKKTLKKGTKVVLKLKSGKTTKQITVKAS